MFYRNLQQITPALWHSRVGPRYPTAALVLLALVAGLAANAGPVHHQIDLRLDPEQSRIEVVDLITGLQPGPAVFNVHSRFTVTASVATGERIELRRRRRGWALAVPSNAEGEVRLHYSAALPSLGEHGAPVPTFVDARGSRLPAGWGWLPSFEGELDVYRITASVPDSQRVLVTAGLQSERLADGEYQAVFRVDPGLEPSLFAGPHRIEEASTGGIRVRTYFEAEFAELSPTYLAAAGTFLQRYGRSIGPYPFEEYSIVSAPIPVGLGYPGVAYISRRILPSPYMRGRSLAHEVLHNWWGNGVYVDYQKGNWAEGLTTFLADYALAEDQGAEPARAMRLAWLRDLAALPRSRDRPVVRFVSKDHDASQVVGYGKVAYVFFMLRELLGREDFATGLRHFWQAQAFKVADWSALQASFQAASERDLEDFFHQWLMRSGGPRLHIEGASVTPRSDTGFEVTLSLRQEPPVYRLSVPVVFSTARGPEERMLSLAGEHATSSWRLDARPTRLAVDPDYRVLRQLEAGELPPILRDVTLSDRAQVLVAVEDPAFGERARALSQRLMDAGVRETDLVSAQRSENPLLVIGAGSNVQAALQALGVVTPVEVQVPGATVRVWVSRRDNGAEVLTVTARDAQSLASVLGPLGYYGRRGYVVFDGPRVLGAGDWRPVDGPMVWRF